MRSRLYYSAIVEAGMEGWYLNFEQVIPFNAELIQVIYSFEADPSTTCSNLIVQRESRHADGSPFLFNYVDIPLAGLGIRAGSCNEVWQFRINDTIRIDWYQGTQIDGFVELVLREADL